MSRVVVYDPDGLNPYGREIGLLFRELGHEVEVLTTVDAEWRPGGVRTVGVLPANRRGRPRSRQALAFARGLLHVLRRGLAGHVVVVVLTRGVADELFLGLLAFLGTRVVVVVHDPTPKFDRRALRVRSSGWLWRRARVRVVHSEQLGRELGAAHALDAHVVDIAPYEFWWREAAPRTGVSSPARRRGRLLVLGQLRPDKGLAGLVRMFEAMDATARAQLELVVCGRGEAPDLGGLVTVVDRSSDDFVDDRVVADALASCDVLLAPYQGATQSATVALALTAGMQVLAFDDGSIGDLVTDDGLVRSGDYQALGERCASYLAGAALGRSRRPGDAWYAAWSAGWAEVLDGS